MKQGRRIITQSLYIKKKY